MPIWRSIGVESASAAEIHRASLCPFVDKPVCSEAINGFLAPSDPIKTHRQKWLPKVYANRHFQELLLLFQAFHEFGPLWFINHNQDMPPLSP
jgi:hypothetical protein